MARNETCAWEISSDGYITFDTTVSNAAIRVARDPATTEIERQKYARQANRNAHSTYEAIRNSRKRG
ncbi:MAG: hypothetical protein R3D86_04870 [Emcibacteraceae bacterium]